MSRPRDHSRRLSSWEIREAKLVSKAQTHVHSSLAAIKTTPLNSINSLVAHPHTKQKIVIDKPSKAQTGTM